MLLSFLGFLLAGNTSDSEATLVEAAPQPHTHISHGEWMDTRTLVYVPNSFVHGTPWFGMWLSEVMIACLEGQRLCMNQ